MTATDDDDIERLGVTHRARSVRLSASLRKYQRESGTIVSVETVVETIRHLLLLY
jgi:hypothetical protein